MLYLLFIRVNVKTICRGASNRPWTSLAYMATFVEKSFWQYLPHPSEVQVLIAECT